MFRTMYIKPSHIGNDIRPIGIELYSEISGFKGVYDYLFDGDIVIEDHVDGKHFYDLSPEIRNLASFKEAAVEFDLATLHMGLGDMRADNYVILDRGVHVPIDFDQMQSYAMDVLPIIQSVTANRLDLSQEEYAEIYQKKEGELAFRVKKKKKVLRQIIALIQLAGPSFGEVATYIQQNNERLLLKYFSH